MPYSTSTTFREAFNAPQTDEVPLILLTIDHPSFDTPFHLVNNNESVVHQAQTYQATAFQIEVPKDSEQEISEALLIVDNIDGDLIAAVRSVEAPFTAEVKVVLSSTPDTVERGPWDLTLKEMRYNATAINFVLGVESLIDEPYPYQIFAPNRYPALF